MKNLQNQIEALLNNYQLTYLIDPTQVRINLDSQQNSDYAMIQAIFNDQIEQATQQRDWQRMIELLKAMVQVSQNVGNYDDTIIAEISLLYLTFSRYYNTDLLQAEINPILMHLQVIMQQANTSYESLDTLIQNVVANLTVPNNLPLGLNPRQELRNLIQQNSQSQASTESHQFSPAPTSLDKPTDTAHQESLSQQDPSQPVTPTNADAESYAEDEDDYDEPFYKKWWFWTLIVLIILIIGIIIKLVITKVSAPSAAPAQQTEQVAKSSEAGNDSSKKASPVQLPNLQV